ncbi:hypothetical protein D515_01572 [Grimontia indica]|uniref:Uncharacterized protein n=1 Tax=Grimontia indica TaxID=1056512 RepID=R1ILS7_9GAMM|nr:hypothetical protein [Grimontia indica]EOD81666.1 hypothetical protein D515_01572 [Grimontia indica]
MDSKPKNINLLQPTKKKALRKGGQTTNSWGELGERASYASKGINTVIGIGF